MMQCAVLPANRHNYDMQRGRGSKRIEKMEMMKKRSNDKNIRRRNRDTTYRKERDWSIKSTSLYLYTVAIVTISDAQRETHSRDIISYACS